MVELFGLVICALIIFQAGKRLSILGEELAVQTGLGQVWMGIILLSAVTSLPELMVGVGSIIIVGSADLAVGDILGSCSFNLFLLAILDAFVPRKNALFGNISGHHIIASALGIILLSIFILAKILPLPIHFGPWIGYPSILFLIIYFLAVRVIHGSVRKPPIPDQEAASIQPAASSELKRVTLIRFSAYSVLIVLSALALPFLTDRLASMIGLSGSFAGTFILAATTSFPEVAVSLSAVRKGSLDLAAGNLLGSNLFNFMILALDDLIYPGADLLRDASSGHLISAVTSIIMVAIAIIGISVHSASKRWLMAWDALLIAVLYVFMLSLLYHTTH